MESIESKNYLYNIGKGILIAIIFTIISLLAFSCLLVFTNLSEETIRPVVITITGISILVGSSMGTRKFRKNGMLSGALIGGIYIICLYLISSIISAKFNINISSIIMIFIGMASGVLGGIIGVNSKVWNE